LSGTVGFVFPSLQTTTLRTNPFGAPSFTVTNYTTCGGNSYSALKPLTGKASFLVNIRGLITGAFRTAAGNPSGSGAVSATESGSYVPTPGTVASAGVPTGPTQIQLTFANVPTGVTLFLPVSVSNSFLVLQAMNGTTAATASTAAGAPAAEPVGSGTGGFLAAYKGSIAGENEGASASYTPTNGSVTVLYSVIQSDRSNPNETVDIPVYYSFTAGSFSTAQSAMTVLESFAPAAAATAATTFRTSHRRPRHLLA
jgi:hypothetical protein